MVKDLDYFMEQERLFKEEHPDYGEMFFDDTIGVMSEKGIDDRLNFLSDGVISMYNGYLEGGYIGNEEQYNLSDAERVMLRLLYCRHSYLFRDDYYYEGIPEVVQNMFDTLDSVVAKAPSNTDPMLYRFCHDHDSVNFQVGDIVKFPYSLSCTNFDWHQDDEKNVYLVTPLSNGRTRAHNMFEICEHGDEKQVNFLRGTSFEVTQIEKREDSNFVKVHLKEIEYQDGHKE